MVRLSIIIKKTYDTKCTICEYYIDSEKCKPPVGEIENISLCKEHYATAYYILLMQKNIEERKRKDD